MTGDGDLDPIGTAAHDRQNMDNVLTVLHSFNFAWTKLYNKKKKICQNELQETT